MKKSKKLLAIFTIMLLIVCMAVPVSAAGKITKKKATLKVGQTLQLKVTGTKGKVKWTSSKKSVATLTRQLQILNIICAAPRQRSNVVDCHFLEFDRFTAYRTFSVALGVHALLLKVIELDSVCHTITLSAP